MNAQFADNRQVWIDNRQYNIQQLDYATLNNVLNGLLAQQAQASQTNDRNLQIFLAQQTSMVQAHLQELARSQQELSKVRDQSAQRRRRTMT